MLFTVVVCPAMSCFTLYTASYVVGTGSLKPVAGKVPEALCCCLQALMQELSDLKGQVKELHDLLNAAVPSHFGSPGSEGLLLAE